MPAEQGMFEAWLGSGVTDDIDQYWTGMAANSAMEATRSCRPSTATSPATVC